MVRPIPPRSNIYIWWPPKSFEALPSHHWNTTIGNNVHKFCLLSSGTRISSDGLWLIISCPCSYICAQNMHRVIMPLANIPIAAGAFPNSANHPLRPLPHHRMPDELPTLLPTPPPVSSRVRWPLQWMVPPPPPRGAAIEEPDWFRFVWTSAKTTRRCSMKSLSSECGLHLPPVGLLQLKERICRLGVSQASVSNQSWWVSVASRYACVDVFFGMDE